MNYLVGLIVCVVIVLIIEIVLWIKRNVFNGGIDSAQFIIEVYKKCGVIDNKEKDEE